MADPLSITAGVVGLLAFAGSTLTKGYCILQSLQGSAKDVKRLLAELSQLTGVLVAIESHEKDANKALDRGRSDSTSIPKILESSILDCRKMMKRVLEILEKLEKSRRATLAVKWQFLEPDIKKATQEIEHYKNIFVLCLGIDVRRNTDEILSLQTEISMQLQDMRDEHEKEKKAAREERARHNRQALLHWLMPKSDEKHAKALKLWTQGTGNWLVQHPDFICWAEGDDSLLWLNGIPGSGKTVLMSRVIEKLKARSAMSIKPIGLAYFYYTYTDSETHGLSQVLCSLAAQLIRCFPRPENGPAMRLFTDCDDGTLAPNADRIQGLLINLMNDMEIVYICLDALDECTSDDKNELLCFIYEVIGKCSNVKILVSSRIGDSEVSEYLDGCSTITVTAGVVARDIDLYIRYRIDHGPERLRRAQSEYMVKKLTSGAEGMFLWVSCQMDQLCRISTSAGVQTALNSLPRGLYGTYSRILNGISPENEIHATRALRWLAHAAAPLGLPELVEAIAVEEDSSSLGTLQKLFVHEDIFQICGSLVRRSEFTGMLSLAHNSVYEFLTTPSSQSRPLEPYYIPTAQSAISLARTCLTYLSFQDFNMVRIQATVDPNLNFTSPVETWETEAFLDRPFFDYALRNWWKHIPASQEDVDQVWPNLLNFFDHETGNFGSLVMLLRHLEGTYRYPMAMQPIHFCATHGLYLVSHRLLGDTPSDVECAVEDGRRALHIAAENGHEDMVRHLLSHDADANKKTLDGRTPLQLALESGNESIVKLLVRGGADVNANFANGETPLSVAVGNKWHSLVRFLLGEKADPNGRLLGGRTSLHVAAEVGSDGDLILLLSDAGADHILGDENSWTALHFAAHYGHEEAALMLMRDPKTPTVFEKVGWTPLHAAIEQEHIEVVRLFDGFAKGVSSLLTNYRVKQQATSPATSRSAFSKALGTAANTGESSRSSTNAPSLSTPEASPAGSTQERVPTPLLLATSQGYLLGVDALMEAGVDSEDVKACIQRAFAKGKGDILERLVRGSEQHIQSLLSLGGKGVAAPQESRETLEFLFRSFQWKVHDILAAMKQVIRQDDQNLLQLLVEQFIQLEDEAGHQKADMLVDVLHVTVQCRNVEAVQLLLVAGAEVSRPIKASLGRHESKTVSCTLLHLAAHLQDSNMVSCLLSNSLSPDIRDAMGRTPLHYAVQYRDAKDVTITLLSSGADASVRDRRGWTPLHVASHYGVSESVPPLLAAGAAIDAPDDEAMTPLHHCAFSFPYNGQFPMPAMLLLLEGNASTSSVDKAGYTPIQLALVTSIRTTAPGYLSSVLDQQTDLISTRLPPLDWTPLHFAANANCGSPILNLLVSRKADLEALDREGKTPLQVAGPTTHQLLLNHGAKWRK